jgi:hypothetical protein
VRDGAAHQHAACYTSDISATWKYPSNGFKPLGDDIVVRGEMQQFSVIAKN